MKHLVRAALALAPLLWACSSYDLEGMALASPLSAIVVGDTVSLVVVASDGSMPSAASVTWASSDDAIATVDELGVVTGTGPGWVVIEARTGDYALKIPLKVWATAGPFLSLGAGADHNCGLAEDGRIWCWGSNVYSQLGDRFSPDRCFFARTASFPCAKAAVPVDTDVRFTELAVGYYHSCGLTIEGEVHCWGYNDAGQLGDGGTETRAEPAPVPEAPVFVSLVAAGRTTCGITTGDDLFCWGRGHFVVDGASASNATKPTRVAPDHAFDLVVPGGSHACGMTAGGATYCWGDNTFGQLGVASVDSICGSSPCTSEPQQVASAAPFVRLALAGDFSCGLTADGVAECWGHNDLGQLGDGTRIDRSEPMPVAGGHTFTRLAVNQGRACGLDGAGLLHCWGQDPAGFGNGGEDPVEVDEPVPAADGQTFAAITIGFDTACGLAPSGVTWCWGGNVDGAVGNGESQSMGLVTTPVRVVAYTGG